MRWVVRPISTIYSLGWGSCRRRRRERHDREAEQLEAQKLEWAAAAEVAPRSGGLYLKTSPPGWARIRHSRRGTEAPE
jgi:hypothetical protein